MKANWEEILKDRLQAYGHRNWLVIADSAYPHSPEPPLKPLLPTTTNPPCWNAPLQF